jgi:hypothetical protein
MFPLSEVETFVLLACYAAQSTSITVEHNILISVIQCYMFWFNKPPAGITLLQPNK